MKLNFSKYIGTTRLKEWWKEVKKHFEAVQTAHNALEDSVAAEKVRLSTEITQRTNADIALSDRINTVESARVAADDTLQENIDQLRADFEIKTLTYTGNYPYFNDDIPLNKFFYLKNEASTVSKIYVNDEIGYVLSESINAGDSRMCIATKKHVAGVDPEWGFIYIVPQSDLIGAEKTARAAADEELKNQINNANNDTILFHYGGTMFAPTIPNGNYDTCQVDINLSNCFTVNGVRCGTMTSTAVTFIPDSNIPTYIYVAFDISSKEITLSASRQAPDSVETLQNNKWIFALGRYTVSVLTDDNPDSPTLGEYYIADYSSEKITQDNVVAISDVLDYVNKGLVTEKTAREAIDTELQIQIDQEITNRQQADSTLESEIAATQSAVNDIKNVQLQNKANIRENPSATDGDIVETHLTVGSRGTGTYGDCSFTTGDGNSATGACSAVIGSSNSVANHECSAVIGGYNNQSADFYAVVIGGQDNYTEGDCGVVIGGQNNYNEGSDSTIIGGRGNVASGSNSIILGGRTCTSARSNAVFGHHNVIGTAGSVQGTAGDAIIVGNGTTENKSNAFRAAYNGNVYCSGEYSSTGADYAEMFEWADGNPNDEDRRGLFAYIENGKIRLANSADTDRRRLGVISARPAVVGDDFDDSWCGKYITDVFGAVMTCIVHYDAEEYTVMITDPETGKRVPKTEIIEAYDAIEPILNPEYDPEREYIPRAQRKEYDCWAFMGKLVVTDDGTCEANGYCYPSENGIATSTKDGFYVLERIDESHIKVLIK